MELPKGVFFDLDGTLVHSNLDFTTMRQAIGCPENKDILSFVSEQDALQQQRSTEIILEHEMRDARETTIMPGVAELLQNLKAKDIKTAILTRNSPSATALKLKITGITVDYVLTREDAAPKPSPEGLLKLAKHFDIPASECVYVGDYRYDLEAAKAAEMLAVLFKSVTNKALQFEHLADITFSEYRDFLYSLEQHYNTVAVNIARIPRQ